jgi:hypothetical protein
LAYKKRIFNDGDILEAKDLTEMSEGIADKQDKENLVNTISETSDDLTYPSAKAVYDFASKGLMTSAERAKLNNIESNANKYIHPETHPVDIIEGLADVAKSGSYKHLVDTPDIPSMEGLATTSYVDEKFKAISTLDISSEINLHNKSNIAHEDIRNELAWHIATSNAHKVNKIHLELEKVENKSSADIRSEITSANITAALGYTPANQTGSASEEYVKAQIANLVDSSPEALNTLNELAAALGDDPNFATTVSEQIGKKADAQHAHTDLDVTLSAPFTITKDFGYYTLNGAVSKQIGTVGQSLHSFLQGAFSVEDKTVFATSPSFGISISGSREAEIGSKVTPVASWNNNAGTYKWGIIENGSANYSKKSTGITYTNGNIAATAGTLGAEITYTANGQTLSVIGSSTRSAVTNHPVSNIGSDIYTELASEYKESKTNSAVTSSATFTGYRKMFMGATSSTAAIDSTLIRGLKDDSNNNGKKAATGDVQVTAKVASSHKKIIWALPPSLANKKITFKYWFNNEWHTLSGVSAATSIRVQGANSETGEEYSVYVYTPAGGAFEADMKTQITIASS